MPINRLDNLFLLQPKDVNIISHLLKVTGFGLVDRFTVNYSAIPAEFIPLPEEAHRSEQC